MEAACSVFHSAATSQPRPDQQDPAPRTLLHALMPLCRPIGPCSQHPGWQPCCLLHLGLAADLAGQLVRSRLRTPLAAASGPLGSGRRLDGLDRPLPWRHLAGILICAKPVH